MFYWAGLCLWSMAKLFMTDSVSLFVSMIRIGLENLLVLTGLRDELKVLFGECIRIIRVQPETLDFFNVA